jgi:hypothetical protein
MRTAFAAIISLTICLLAAGCYAQIMSYPQNVGGDFGRNWISSFQAQYPQPAETNLKNDLWSWGSSHKSSRQRKTSKGLCEHKFNGPL